MEENLSNKLQRCSLITTNQPLLFSFLFDNGLSYQRSTEEDHEEVASAASCLSDLTSVDIPVLRAEFREDRPKKKSHASEEPLHIRSSKTLYPNLFGNSSMMDCLNISI